MEVVDSGAVADLEEAVTVAEVDTPGAVAFAARVEEWAAAKSTPTAAAWAVAMVAEWVVANFARTVAAWRLAVTTAVGLARLTVA
jgi:hypothetical protein